MKSPILELEHNILAEFEKTNSTTERLVKDAINSGVLSDTIHMDESKSPPRAPYVRDCEGGAEIVIHVAFLEFLWAFIYGWFVLYEEGVQRPMIDGTFKQKIVIDNSLKIRSVRLLAWALGLRRSYTQWSNDLPSPISVNEDESQYILRANSIFLKSIIFCMHHEFAHIRLRHFGFLKNEDGSPKSEESIVQMENEADESAFSSIFGNPKDEYEKKITALSTLMAVLSSTYLVEGVLGLRQIEHPHLHHRVSHMLSRFSFTDEETFYFYVLADVVLSIKFSEDHQQPDDQKIFDTAEDALQYRLDMLDQRIFCPD